MEECKYCNCNLIGDAYKNCYKCGFFWFNGKLSGINIDKYGTKYIILSFDRRIISLHMGFYDDTHIDYEYTTEENFKNTLIRLKDNIGFM